MLIFDRFQDRKTAEEFAADVERTFNLSAQVFDDQEESNKVDQFPFELTPPIVLVERPGHDSVKWGASIECKVEEHVRKFGGKFAGT